MKDPEELHGQLDETHIQKNVSELLLKETEPPGARKEWTACNYMIAVGAFILISGVLFNLADIYFELKDPLILHLIVGLIILGLIAVGAGTICKLLWRRRYVGR